MTFGPKAALVTEFEHMLLFSFYFLFLTHLLFLYFNYLLYLSHVAYVLEWVYAFFLSSSLMQMDAKEMNFGKETLYLRELVIAKADPKGLDSIILWRLPLNYVTTNFN